MKWTIAVLLLVLPACFGQDGTEHNLACIKSIVVPPYPPIARQARVAGTVRVKVTVSDTGRAEKVEFDDAGLKAMLRDPVNQKMQSSQFDPACRGKVVAFEFVFEFHDDLPPSDNGPDQIVFRGPNVFVIGTPFPVVKF